MDARETLLELSKERGASLAKLSGLLGRNSSYLSQFIKKGSPRKLEEGDRRTLAQFFGVPEVMLGGPKQNAGQEISRDSLIGSGWGTVSRLSADSSRRTKGSPSDGKAFDAFQFSRRWMVEQGLDGAELAAFAVQGDAMEPLLNDGDEVLIDCRELPLRDGIYIVQLSDTLLVRRVARSAAGRYTLLSQNLSYPPVDVAENEVEIIGRVVWKGGKI